MQYIKINNGQTLIDLAMEHAGSTEAAFAMSLQNDIPITQELQAGNEIPAPTKINEEITNAFTVEKAKPCSTLSLQQQNEGVDYWQIEDDFVVQ